VVDTKLDVGMDIWGQDPATAWEAGMSRLLFSVVASLVAVVSLAGSSAQAQNWPDTLFTEKSFDFGPVPRGGVVRHPFVLTNRLAVPISIVNLRVSCGCTSGTASASLVQPGQTAIIEAQMDTRNFMGPKSTTLFVAVVAGNQQTEVGLGVSSLILTDVVLNPGSFDFGMVARGQTPAQVLSIERIGKPDWRITKLVSASKALTATLAETKRTGAEVGYQLTVALRPDAPAGVIRDEIRLMTNNSETASIPLLINGQVRGNLSASPSLVTIGSLAASSPALQGKVIVRASKPFKVTRIDGQGDGFTLAAADATAKPLHVVTLTYNPKVGTSRGDLHKTFRIVTDLAGEPPLDVAATVHVDP